MRDTAGIVGRYELVREIGRGGMATVFLARQVDLDRFVALKQLVTTGPHDEQLVQRFLRESRLAGSLAHPCIVTVFDFVESDGSQYIAMELMPRGSLRQYLAAELTPAQVGGVLADTLAGLAYAERHGIVHRDLKPENLMVTGEGGVKIADFGIAKATALVHTNDFRTATGLTMGTPGYMAPEQAMGQQVGPWTDLYSLGCMAYELVVGQIPFSDSTVPMALLLRHINEPIPPAVVARPGVDPGLSAWIERLLVKDPEQRTREAAAALDELEELLIGLVGPRWRRSAALPEYTEPGAIPGPWTPPPRSGYDTFRGEEPPRATPPVPAAGDTSRDEEPPRAVTPLPVEPPRETDPGETPPRGATPPPARAATPSPVEPARASDRGEAPPRGATPPPRAATPSPVEPARASDPGERRSRAATPAPAAGETLRDEEPPAGAAGEIWRDGEPPAATTPPARASDPGAAPPRGATPPPRAATPAPVEPVRASDPGEVPPRGATPPPARAATPSPVEPARVSDPGAAPSRAATPPAGETSRGEARPRAATYETYRGDGPARAATPRPTERAPEPAATIAPAPPTPEQTRTRTARRRPARGVVLGLAALLVGGAVAVAVVASGGEDTPEPPAEQAVRTSPGVTLRAGPASAATAPGWKTVSAPPELAGLKLDPVSAAGPAGDGEQGAVLLGLAPKSAHTPSLLPPAFLAALGLRPDVEPDREPAHLGKAFEAYRYAGLRAPKLSRALDLYVAPTTAGVLTLACIAPKELDTAFSEGCAAAAQSVEAEGVRGFPLGPDREFAGGLSTIVEDLRDGAKTGHTALRRATADEGRYRSTSRTLGNHFGEAAAAFEKLDAGPAAASLQRRLQRALTGAAADYAALSTAARRSRPERSRTAARKAGAAERDVASALAAILDAGYDDLVEPRFKAGSPPSLKRKPRPPKPTTQRPTQPDDTSTAPPAANPTVTPRPTNPQPTATTQPTRPKPTATARPPVTTEG